LAFISSSEIPADFSPEGGGDLRGGDEGQGAGMTVMDRQTKKSRMQPAPPKKGKDSLNEE
jgi:hypothetical protein